MREMRMQQAIQFWFKRDDACSYPYFRILLPFPSPVPPPPTGMLRTAQ